MPMDPLAVLLGLREQGGGGADQLLLSSLRQQRRPQMARNLSRRSPTFGTGATDADLGQLDYDIAADPDTGVVQQSRVAQTQSDLHDASMFNRPEIAGPRHELQDFELAKELLPAQVAAQGQAQGRADSFFNQLALQQQAQGARADQARETQAGIADRTANTQQSQTNRTMLTSALRERDAHKRAEPAARGIGVMDFLTNSNERRAADLQEIEQRIQQYSGGADLSDADDAALYLLEKGLSIEEAIASGELEGADLTPQDLQDLQAAMQRWGSQ